MAFRVSARKNVRIGRVIGMITSTALALWVGSSILSSVAVSMNQTTNIFAKGFTLIGFGASATGVLDGTVSTTGILSVVGLIGFASIVLQFIQVKF